MRSAIRRSRIAGDGIWRDCRDPDQRLQAEQRAKFSGYLGKSILRTFSEMSYCPAFPINGFQLIDQYRTTDGQTGRNHDFKRIAFYFTRDRAYNGQVSFLVERSLSQYKGGTCAGLLASQRGIEIKVDKIAAFWNVSSRGGLPGFFANRLAPIN
jgi:hypothetical protein